VTIRQSIDGVGPAILSPHMKTGSAARGYNTIKICFNKTSEEKLVAGFLIDVFIKKLSLLKS